MNFKNIFVRLSTNTGAFATEMGSASAAVDHFGRRVDSASVQAGRAGDMMKKVLAAGAIAVGAAIGASVLAAAQFDASMRNVNSISALSEGQFKAQSRAVIELSKTLPQSANELAKGLYDIASSGFQGAEGLKVLEASAKAGSAGLSDTKTAAQGITAVLNAYGMGAESAGHVSDVLFQTVNKGVISFGELAGTMGDFVGQARAAGVSVEEATAALAAMTLSGISASEAGTSLNRLLQSMIEPSEALAATFKEWGFETGEAALKGLGLHGVMQRINTETGGNVTQLQALFKEQRAVRGAFGLTGAAMVNYNETFEANTNIMAVNGATQRALEEQAKSLSFQFDRFKNNVVALGIQFGSTLIPSLGKTLDFIQDLARGAVPMLQRVFSGLAPFMGNVVNIARDLGSIFSTLAQVAAPIAAIFLGLVSTVVIQSLNGLSSALSSITGFFADNKWAAEALAAVLVASLVPKLIAAGVALKTLLVTGIADMLWKAAVNASALGAGLAKLGTGSMIAGGAIVAAISGAVLLLYKLAQASEEGTDKAQKFTDALAVKHDLKNYEGVVMAVGDINAQIKDAEARQNRFRLSDLTFGLVGATAESKALGSEIAALKARQLELAGSSARGTEAIRRVGVVTGLSAADVKRLAIATGTDLGGAVENTVPKLVGMHRATGNAGPPTEKLGRATNVLADAAASAEDKVKALKDALDALIGVNLSAEEAESKFREGMDKVTESAYKNGKALDLMSSAGRENRENIRGGIGDINKWATSLLDAGRGPDEVRWKMAAAREEMIDRMVPAFGISRQEASLLLDQYGFTAGSVQGLIDKHGGLSQQMRDDLPGAAATWRSALADTGVAVDNLSVQAQHLLDMFHGLLTGTLPEIKAESGPGGILAATTAGLNQPGAEGPTRRFGAQGMILDFYASGGLREHHVAQVAPAGAMRVWAEPETGGEAYIPFAGDRSRNLSVWAQAGKRLGVQGFAEGGTTGGEDEAGMRAARTPLYGPAASGRYERALGAKTDKERAAERETERITKKAGDHWRGFGTSAGQTLTRYGVEMTLAQKKVTDWRSGVEETHDKLGKAVDNKVGDMGARTIFTLAATHSRTESDWQRNAEIEHAILSRSMSAIEMTMAAGADRSVVALTTRLNAGALQTSEIARNYSRVLVGGINPVLSGVGAPTVALPFAAGGKLPDHAKIERNTGVLVQWAEPETGGEAFIPLSPAKRRTSVPVLEETAGEFGFDLVPHQSFAVGGRRGERINAAIADSFEHLSDDRLRTIIGHSSRRSNTYAVALWILNSRRRGPTPAGPTPAPVVPRVPMPWDAGQGVRYAQPEVVSRVGTTAVMRDPWSGRVWSQPMISAAGGGYWTRDEMAGLAGRHGFPDVPLAIAIAAAESGWNASASNTNVGGSIDRGLWQINSIHGALSTFDPEGNASAAFSISGGGSNWNPWTVYKSGAYQKYLHGESPGAGGSGPDYAAMIAALPQPPSFEGLGDKVGHSAAVATAFMRAQVVNELQKKVSTGSIAPGAYQSILAYLDSHGMAGQYQVTSTTGGQHAPGSYHPLGKAVDMVGNMSGIFDTLAGTAPSLYELFYDPKGRYVKGGQWIGGAIGGHMDHVHAAVFDEGGILPPGLTLAYNGTGRNERVVSDSAPAITIDASVRIEGSLNGDRHLLKEIDAQQKRQVRRITRALSQAGVRGR